MSQRLGMNNNNSNIKINYFAHTKFVKVSPKIQRWQHTRKTTTYGHDAVCCKLVILGCAIIFSNRLSAVKREDL